MKKYRSEAEWRLLFSEQKRSGMNAKNFCREKGICVNVYYRKKKSLAGEGGLVKLPVKLEKGTAIEINVGSVTIRLRSGFAEQELVRVLRCVREALDA
jgi:hypothetical protein